MDFSQQTVIVTGGTRGIGRGISEAFLKSGATVIATYAGNDAAAAKMKEENAQYADRIHTFKCDVRDEAAVIEFLIGSKKNSQRLKFSSTTLESEEIR